jgi:hypothetical protein
MIADERINGFVNGFLDSWLNLRDLGGMPPPREVVRAYYAEDLPSSMKTEARLFFRDLLKNNGSVAQFIDCEHTFVDKKLAKLYDLPEKDKLRLADGFQKVSLKGNNASRRPARHGCGAHRECQRRRDLARHARRVGHGEHPRHPAATAAGCRARD